MDRDREGEDIVTPVTLTDEVCFTHELSICCGFVVLVVTGCSSLTALHRWAPPIPYCVIVQLASHHIQCKGMTRYCMMVGGMAVVKKQ